MGRLLQQPGPAAVIGLDIPGVGRHHCAAAFAALGRHDAALGPATDRRFWLNGARGVLPPGLFAGINWSGEHASKDTRASAPACVGAWRRLWPMWIPATISSAKSGV
jgi:hypothetical protein